MKTHQPILEVDNLSVEFSTSFGTAKAVNGVSFSVEEGKCLAILGESGSGKSVTAQAIMGILDTPPARVTGGQVLYRGNDLLNLPERERVQIRGREIAMIFQDALSALNPVYTVGVQIAEAYRVHNRVSRREGRRRALELMELVRIPAATERIDDYPHQFSGGMRQRIMIAMALAMDPKVLIADEPTTALDVTVQAEIMDLLAEIRIDRKMAVVLITHDLGVVAETADDVVVMYAGRTVEKATIYDLFDRPSHPYTQGLLASMPNIDRVTETQYSIPGTPPTLTNIPAGCSFAPRCSMAKDICRETIPQLLSLGEHRSSACHFAHELESSLR